MVTTTPLLGGGHRNPIILYRSLMVDQLEKLVRYEPVFASREAPEDQMTRRRGDLNAVFERNSRKRQRVASKTS